jgi:hypothetical protein
VLNSRLPSLPLGAAFNSRQNLRATLMKNPTHELHPLVRTCTAPSIADARYPEPGAMMPRVNRRSVLMNMLVSPLVPASVVASPLKPAEAAPAAETALSGLAPSVADASDLDPIFAAINAERDAYAVYVATDEVQTRIYDQDPRRPEKRTVRSMKRPAVKAWWAEYQKAEAVHRKATQKWAGAREAFLRTQPTTVAGLRAFVDHIDGPFSHGGAGEAYWDNDEKALVFPTIAAAVRGLIATTVARQDTELLRLCAKAVALDKEQETIYTLPEEQWGPFEERFCERQRIVSQAIILTPSHTLAGLQAKAKVIVDSCWGGEENDFEDFVQCQQATTDQMILWSIFRDLAGMPHDPTKHGRPEYSSKIEGAR